MKRRKFLKTISLTASALAFPVLGNSEEFLPLKPNFLHIVLDELGYFELSCMGNDKLKTPVIDDLAKNGIRFTQLLAGGPVCAPTRSVLMTGQHLGHTTVRANGGGQALREDDITIAQVLKKAGYATGGFGKWGLGDAGTTGVPEKHGFDIFFGYYHQVHAHSYFPRYLLKNGERVYLEGNTDNYSQGKKFSHYLIFEETVKFLKANKNKPFYCYCPWTTPHGQWGIPETEPAWLEYKDKKWDDAGKGKDDVRDAKIYAAMVRMADRQIGELRTLLKELGIERNTLIIVTGDNGGCPYFSNKKYQGGFFNPNGGKFRGGKGVLYEGGLRVPAIIAWPGYISAGVSDLLCSFADIMPTLAELAGIKPPDNIDGISIVPALLGEKRAGRKQPDHEYLYWEYGGAAAVRMNNWKAVLKSKKSKKNNFVSRNTVQWELYDLNKDIGEKKSVAARNPEILDKMKRYAKMAHAKNVVGITVKGEENKTFDLEEWKRNHPKRK